MSLRLITGLDSDRTTGTLRSWLRSVPSGGQPLLLLPSMPDVLRAAREFAAAGELGIKPMVLGTWVAETWALYGDGRQLVGGAGRAILMERAIRTAGSGQLPQSASTPGFLRLLCDIAQRTVDPIADHPGCARDVAAILGVYQDLLAESGYIEPAAATVAIAGDPPSGQGRIGLDRFTDLSAAQERLVLALASQSEVAMSLTWEEGAPATEVLDELVKRLEDGGAELDPAATEPECGAAPAQLTTALYRGGAPLEPDGHVRLGLATGDESECALVARIAKQCSEVDPDARIAIAFRGVAGRLALLTAALDAEGLDYAVDVAVAFPATPLGAALMALVDACSGHEDARERMLAFLLSPYSGADVGAVSSLDTRWRRRRPAVQTLLDDAARLKGKAGEAVGEARALAAGVEGAAAAEKWEYLAGLLLSNGMGAHGVRSPQGVLDAAAHRVLLDAVSEVLAVAPEGGGCRGATRALGVSKVAVGAQSRDPRVLVTEAERLRGLRFDVVILGGMTSSEFSAERPKPLSAVLLETLGQPVGSEERLAERMLFHAVISSARKSLFLVRQSVDSKGEDVRPSVFIDEVLDVYRTLEQAERGEIPPGMEIIAYLAGDVVSAAPAFGQARREVRLRLGGTGSAPVIGRGRIEDPAVLETLALECEYSVSEAETYLSCPYRWYYDRVVSPRELDAEFDAAERGSLAHRLLARFYEEWTSSGKGRVTVANLDEALRLFDRTAVADADAGGRVAPQKLEERLSYAKAVSWARSVVEDDVAFLPGFRPTRHEFRFGGDAGPAVSIGGVALRGSIDRIDSGPAGLVVTDYKSSSNLKGASSFPTYGLLQAPLYMQVASQLLDMPAMGGVYRSLRTLEVRGLWRGDVLETDSRWKDKDGVDEAGVAECVEDAITRLKEAVAGMREGRIPRVPGVSGACRYCGIRATCEEAR